jgi:cofilin
MMSGLEVSDEVAEEFKQLRMKRKYRFIIFKPSEDKSKVEVEQCGERALDWAAFVEAVPKNNSRWIVYDLEWKEADGRACSKICYIMYSPDDNADNTEKFVVACNKDAVKAKLNGVNRDYQINRWDDLKEDVFIAAFNI